MSNRYYKNAYSTLNKETSYNCESDSKCTCTNLYGRTEYDKMMYKWATTGTGLPDNLTAKIKITDVVEFKQ